MQAICTKSQRKRAERKTVRKSATNRPCKGRMWFFNLHEDPEKCSRLRIPQWSRVSSFLFSCRGRIMRIKDKVNDNNAYYFSYISFTFYLFCRKTNFLAILVRNPRFCWLIRSAKASPPSRSAGKWNSQSTAWQRKQENGLSGKQESW